MKYSEELKLLVAEDYCSGNDGLKVVAARHGVDVSAMRSWIAGYKAHGAAGIKRKKRVVFSAEFKLSVVRRMREENLSCRQVAALFDVRRFDVVTLWAQQYDEGGLDALAPRSPGCHMPPPQTPSSRSPDDETRSREELLDELNHLRAENAYLKKLKALVQAKKRSAPQKKR
jgi:transposase